MEVVPLPREKIENREPVSMVVRGLDVWDGQSFRVQLDWNGSMGRWVVRITHLATGTTFARSPASLMQSYSYEPYISFVFFDPANEETKVSPDNLGRTVKLGVFPLGENV